MGEKWGDNSTVQELTKSFEKAHEALGHKTWIVGRTTMEKDFTHHAAPIHKLIDYTISREDHVAKSDAASYAIAIDGHGKLGWNSAEMLGEHVITVLTEAVQDSYLAHLQEIGVSYVFAGEDKINLPVALEKLKTLFNIEILMLEGGGHLNGSFLNEGLIDEYHQLLLPLADGRTDTSSVFEIEEKDRRCNATLLKLQQVKQLEDDVLWLTYKVNAQV
ncbi:dihydrofolate reductase family protein [Chitinophaga rhizophila]|uniref:RibD family protein n=1 Tax=Chitinophaga rhizophila TaxID=2866212 RepID=A0ABS7GHS2_9BACT|nr:RibD family protein [Chitinophaga rhizophila]MBW8686790.1 RibD family protein [Chitinophaga rhizophila]